MHQEPLVKNAADEKQLDAADKKLKAGALQEVDDMQKVLATIQGRRVLWRTMMSAGLFSSVLSNSGSMVYYNAGKQDLALQLKSAIEIADESAFAKMLIENQ